MYNKYLQTACPPADAPPCPPPERQESGSILSSLGNLFGKEGGLSRLFEQDTLLVLLILYGAVHLCRASYDFGYRFFAESQMDDAAKAAER